MNMPKTLDTIIEKIDGYCTQPIVQNVTDITLLSLCTLAIGAEVSRYGAATHKFHLYRPLFDHTGDACFASAIMATQKGLQKLNVVKKYSAELSTLFWAGVVVAMENIPNLPGCTMDKYDIPAGILGAVATYMFMRGRPEQYNLIKSHAAEESRLS